MQWLGTLGGQAPHLGCGLAHCGHPGHRGRSGPYTVAVARPAIHVPTPQRHPLPPSQPPPPPPRPPFLISVAGVRLVERLPRPCRWRCWRLCRGAKRGPRAMLLTRQAAGRGRIDHCRWRRHVCVCGESVWSACSDSGVRWVVTFSHKPTVRCGSGRFGPLFEVSDPYMCGAGCRKWTVSVG